MWITQELKEKERKREIEGRGEASPVLAGKKRVSLFPFYNILHVNIVVCAYMCPKLYPSIIIYMRENSRAEQNKKQRGFFHFITCFCVCV